MNLFSVLLFCMVLSCCGQMLQRARTRRFPTRERQKHRGTGPQRRRNENVCYPDVGCFERRPPLNKHPESPDVIGTKFYLFQRRLNFSYPELLLYEDRGLLLNNSKFNPQQSTKVVIHGYLGWWNEPGALEVANAYLKIYDCNVVLVDWHKGARGPHYTNAVTNTEIVGRQLGVLLLHMINLGSKPKQFHLIGFSLGAHVAGITSQLLKVEGHLIGRITGLDAASPLFRRNNLRDKSKKLDISDATLVDVIHTDASPIFTDGFGLLEPIGHVDFFPNGGFQQPGCVDGKASVILSQLDKRLTKDVACSHTRSWELFLETLKVKASHDDDCEFTAFKCRGGLESFQRGECFPQLNMIRNELKLDASYMTDIGKLGEDVEGEGVMYLVTRNARPYCGDQFQASIHLSEKQQSTVGMLHLRIQDGGEGTNFKMFCKTESFNGRREVNTLSSVFFNSFNQSTDEVVAKLTYVSELEEGDKNAENLLVDQVTIRDMKGNSWHYCNRNTFLPHLKSNIIHLSRTQC